VHVDDETIVFVREGEEESLLVLAATDDVEVTVPAVAVPGAAAAATLFGDAALTEEADGVTLRSTGPVFAVWALPGVTAPSRGR
jgi:alpha-glucosidase